jgi:hypothetical protein
MKQKFFNALAFFVGIVTVVAIIHSCKKTDTSLSVNTEKEQIEAVKKATVARYGNSSAPLVYPINTIADQMVVDNNGNEVVVRKIRNNAARTLACSSYDCAIAEANGLDPSGFETTYTLTSAEVYAGCGTANGTKVTVTWNVSVPYTLLATNGTFTSKGRLRFVNSAGTVLFSTVSITPITITALGADPTCGNNKLFRVTYSLSNVLDSYLGNNNKMECGLFVYTNCSLVPTNIAAWTQAIVFPTNSTFALPCNRIDKLWFNPSTGTAVNQCASVAGAYLTCPAPPANFVRTTSQQVEYRKRVVASYDWNAQPIATSPVINGVVPPVATGAKSATVSSCCGVLFLKDMVQGASTLGWLVRYRNRNTGCATAYLVTDPLYSTSPWVLGTYTTEFWPY